MQTEISFSEDDDKGYEMVVQAEVAETSDEQAEAEDEHDDKGYEMVEQAEGAETSRDDVEKETPQDQ